MSLVHDNVCLVLTFHGVDGIGCVNADWKEIKGIQITDDQDKGFIFLPA